jgi:hypothetical protein
MGTRITVASSQQNKFNYSERLGIITTNSFREFKIPNNIQLDFGRYTLSSNNLSIGTTIVLGGNSVVANGGFLETSSNTSLTLPGAFTIEVWSRVSSSQFQQTIFELGTFNNGILYRVGTGGNGVYINGSSPTVTVPQNFGLWNHLAICRDASNNLAIFFNGSRVSIGSFSGSINSAGDPIRIGGSRHTSGQFFYGNISQCRIVKGSTVYDPLQNIITVPTSPLTAISNTSVLLCQAASTLTDLGPNNLTITTGGTAPIVSSDDPFQNSLSSVGRIVGFANGYFESTSHNANTIYTKSITENARLSVKTTRTVYTNDLILDKNIERLTVQTNIGSVPYNYRQLVINSGNYNTIQTRKAVPSNITIGGGGPSGPNQIWF